VVVLEVLQDLVYKKQVSQVVQVVEALIMVKLQALVILRLLVHRKEIQVEMLQAIHIILVVQVAELEEQVYLQLQHLQE
jgi:hypothetical protein